MLDCEEGFEAIVFLGYPADDILAIETIVRERDSLVALLTGDLYSLIGYLDARPNYEYFGYLDRNVYTRIASLVSDKSPQPDSHRRWAAAILAFSQIAKITFDYASSIYELASNQGGEAATEEIRRFRIADNSDPRLFIDYALGRADRIEQGSLANVEEPNQLDPALFEKRTSDFRIHYIFALKIAALARENIEPAERMLRFIEWMHNGFMFGPRGAAIRKSVLLAEPSWSDD